MPARPDDDWLLVRCGSHDVSLRSAKDIRETGAKAGLPQVTIDRLLELSTKEWAVNEVLRQIEARHAEEDCLTELCDALRNHLYLLKEIYATCGAPHGETVN